MPRISPARACLPACPAGEKPTLVDWETHMTTVFPEVRLKKFLEMRGADGGPWRLICALPALWVGLLYDEQAQVGWGALRGCGSSRALEACTRESYASCVVRLLGKAGAGRQARRLVLMV